MPEFEELRVLIEGSLQVWSHLQDVLQLIDVRHIFCRHCCHICGCGRPVAARENTFACRRGDKIASYRAGRWLPRPARMLLVRRGCATLSTHDCMSQRGKVFSIAHHRSTGRMLQCRCVMTQ